MDPFVRAFVGGARGTVDDVEVINYPRMGSYNSRFLTIQRNSLLNFLNEHRTDKNSYKKYLLITLTGDEVINMHSGKMMSLVRKTIPDWVLNEIKEGREVKTFVTLDRFENYRYIHYNTGNSSMIMRYSDRSRRFTTAESANYSVLNSMVFAKVNLSGIIKSEVDEEGIYSKEINDISKDSDIDIEKLEKFGKIKPIYLLKFNDFTLFPVNLPVDQNIFMIKFDVMTEVNDLNEIIYKLAPIKLVRGSFKNMGVVWF